MRVIRYLKDPLNIKKPVVALGNFDGLHRGHKELILKAVEYALEIGGTPVVFTFYPHPAKILKGTNMPFLIQTFKDKACMMMDLGIETIIAHRFSKEFASLEPEEFVKEMLVKLVGVHTVFVGYDYTFGYKGRGTVDTLKQLSNKLGFGLRVIPPVCVNGIIVSSSKIRELLRLGDVKSANELLGYRYFVSGFVKKGSGRGKQLGFPTANIYPKEEIILKSGVYASYVYVGGKRFTAAVNVGENPTFENAKPHVEAFILDFHRELYGEKIRIEFIEFLRKEEKFSSVQELIDAIRRDVEMVRRVV